MKNITQKNKNVNVVMEMAAILDFRGTIWSLIYFFNHYFVFQLRLEFSFGKPPTHITTTSAIAISSIFLRFLH